jgi:hypothetical protein
MELIEGRALLPRIGEVVVGSGTALPWLVHDGAGREIEPVSNYLRDLTLGDVSPLTCRSYAYDLLRWFRVSWRWMSDGSRPPKPRRSGPAHRGGWATAGPDSGAA